MVDSTGAILNTIEWDGETQFNPGEGITLVNVPYENIASPGDRYENGEVIKPQEQQQTVD